MENTSIVALGFLFIGGAFVYTLLKSIMALLEFGMKTQKVEAQNMSKVFLNMFKWPLISFVVLLLFIIFVVPALT